MVPSLDVVIGFLCLDRLTRRSAGRIDMSPDNATILSRQFGRVTSIRVLRSGIRNLREDHTLSPQV